MARGKNVNSLNNLKPLSTNEARLIGQKGGRASAEVRGFYKNLRTDLIERCTPERIARINEKLISMAEHGNLKAYELIRDGLGERPSYKVKVSYNPFEALTDDELRKIVDSIDE